MKSIQVHEQIINQHHYINGSYFKCKLGCILISHCVYMCACSFVCVGMCMHACTCMYVYRILASVCMYVST